MIKYLAIGLVALLVGVMVYSSARQFLEKMFAPAMVTLEETYSAQVEGDSFDHSLFDTVLRDHVQTGGWVDYQALRKAPEDLDSYIASLGGVKFAALSRDQKLALLINAYNAFTLRLILDHLPLDSIRDIPKAERWEAVRWQVGSMKLSLLSLENDILRARFREPRMHFAINCASVGCPPLRSEAYRGADIDSQLSDQAALVHRQSRWFHLDREAQSLDLTRLYLWYGNDFEQVGGSVLEFAGRHSPALASLMATDSAVSITWLSYDWSLNHLGSPARR